MNAILFLDDDPEQIRLYRQLSHHYLKERQVFFAKTVLEAQQILHTEEIGILVLELMIPCTNGADMIVNMQEKHEFDNINIIVVSKAKKGCLLYDAIKENVSDYLLKSELNEKSLAARILNPTPQGSSILFQ